MHSAALQPRNSVSCFYQINSRNVQSRSIFLGFIQLIPVNNFFFFMLWCLMISSSANIPFAHPAFEWGLESEMESKIPSTPRQESFSPFSPTVREFNFSRKSDDIHSTVHSRQPMQRHLSLTPSPLDEIRNHEDSNGNSSLFYKLPIFLKRQNVIGDGADAIADYNADNISLADKANATKRVQNLHRLYKIRNMNAEVYAMMYRLLSIKRLRNSPKNSTRFEA